LNFIKQTFFPFFVNGEFLFFKFLLKKKLYLETYRESYIEKEVKNICKNFNKNCFNFILEKNIQWKAVQYDREHKIVNDLDM